jgi:hypothetical protein
MNNAIINEDVFHKEYPYVKYLCYSAECQKYYGVVYTSSPTRLTRREMNTILSNTIGWSYLNFKLYNIHE